MNLEDFLNKHIIVNLRDGTDVEGILIEVKDIDDVSNSIFYTMLIIRVDHNEYRTIYINEVESVCEIS